MPNIETNIETNQASEVNTKQNSTMSANDSPTMSANDAKDSPIVNPRSLAVIQDLKQSSEDDSSHTYLKLKVRVLRLCHVKHPVKKSLLYVSMVLIDEERNYIYATMPSSIWQYFRSKIFDGKIYMIKRFDIVPNAENYRVVSDNKLMMKFYFDTYVKVIDQEGPKIPLHIFDFVKYHNLDSRRDNHLVLTDLLGLVKDEHIRPNYFALEIEDEGNQRVRVTLWDQQITAYNEQKEKLKDKTQAVYVIVTSLMIKSYNGYNSVSTSSASIIYVNLDIPEVNELRAIKSGKDGVTSMAPTLKEIATKDIASILEHCKSNYTKDYIFYCLAEVTDITRRKPWHYTSCTTCASRPQYNVAIFYCHRCEKEVETPTIRYRIELKVQDNNGTTTFVIFDNEAKKHIGQDALSLLDFQSNEEKDDSKIPKLIYNTFVGKEFLFKIKAKDTNHDSSNRKNSFNIEEIIVKTATENTSIMPRSGEKRQQTEIDQVDCAQRSKYAKPALTYQNKKRFVPRSKAETSKIKSGKSHMEN